MDKSLQQPTAIVAPLGMVERHAGLLTVPADGQLLYKMMTVENLLRSISASYLHFNRVDAYCTSTAWMHTKIFPTRTRTMASNYRLINQVTRLAPKDGSPGSFH